MLKSAQQRIKNLDKIANKLHLYSLAENQYQGGELEGNLQDKINEASSELQRLVSKAISLMPDSMQDNKNTIRNAIRPCLGKMPTELQSLEVLYSCALKAASACRDAATTSILHSSISTMDTKYNLEQVASQLNQLARRLDFSQDMPRKEDKPSTSPSASILKFQKLYSNNLIPITEDGLMGPETSQALTNAKASLKAKGYLESTNVPIEKVNQAMQQAVSDGAFHIPNKQAKKKF